LLKTVGRAVRIAMLLYIRQSLITITTNYNRIHKIADQRSAPLTPERENQQEIEQ